MMIRRVFSLHRSSRRPRAGGPVIAAAAVAFGGLLATLVPAATAHAVTLKIATLAPGGSSWLNEMKATGDAIEKATDGRVKLKFYPGGVMGNDETVLRKMRAGQLQGGAFPSGAVSGLVPDVDLYSLPLMFRSYDEVDYVRKRLDHDLVDALAKKGIVVLAFSDNGFAYLMSDRRVSAVSDLDSAKVWVPQGDVMSETALKVVGVSPIQLPLPDVYTGLQTGLIDTIAAPPIGAIAFQWHTQVKYLTDAPLMYLLGLIAIDARAWKKISPADQKIVREQVAAASAELDRENRVGEREAYKALGKQGIETVEPASQVEVERWRELSRKAVAELRTKNIYSNDRIDHIQSLLADYRKNNGNSGGD